MSNSGKLHLAFLGCGGAARAHARRLRKIDPDLAISFASRDQARAEQFARELGGAGAFGAYEEAIESDDVDAVFVVTPPSSHLELTLAALAGKKHALVEKPAFLSAEDFDEVESQAARAGRRVLVAENYYYKPLRRRLERLLQDEVCGDLVCLYLNALKHQETEGWRDDPALAGGGALFEGGIHWINLLANLGVPVRRARGFSCGSAPLGRERSSVVALEYEGGAVGTLFYSWDVPSPLKGLRVSRIYGTRGSIFFESNGLIVGVYGTKKRIHFPGLRDIAGYRAMFEDFLGALREDREPEMTLAAARRDVELILQAAEAPPEGKEDAVRCSG